jgi:hypothetical protein
MKISHSQHAVLQPTKEITLTKIVYFSKIYYHATYQDLTWSGAIGFFKLFELKTHVNYI